MADRKVLFKNITTLQEVSPSLDFILAGGLKATIQINIAEVAGDPVAVPNSGIVYVKDVAGISQLFFLSDDGTPHQITPVGTGSGGGWTDDGAVVRLTSVADQVSVGSPTPLGDSKVHVEGPVLYSAAGQTYLAGAGGVIAMYVVYKNTTLSQVLHANASSLATSNGVVGVASAATAAGLPVRVDNGGFITVVAETGVSIVTGDTIFLTSATSGRVTNVAPSSSGQVVVVLGTAKTSTLAPGSSFDMVWAPRTPVVIP